FVSLWTFHYFYRSLLFPFRLKSRKDIPLSIAGMGFFFNIVNSLLNMISITHVKKYNQSWTGDPRFLAGIVLFIVGFLLHYISDSKLINLRKKGDLEYRIPEGGMFNLVSSPNYLGEILEWTGWAIATWSLAGLSFALWTFANLAPRALANHRWYKANFPFYPKNRKALIPYLL
ncbi:MAG: 3-oxo-5-alpha-steroid 4-dehydrogenase, partial [bacterium]|nr:3-oxo-5-alpha-steroid 4-dehydrogenase [bacterium]